jgi:poly(3-hydroxybutyrate) depolymerase
MDNGIEAADLTCFPDTTPTCYDSCVDNCSRCSWSTCVDDVHFIKHLLHKLEREYNIDTDAIFVTGQSNGAMFTHYLTSREPHIPRAVMPVFGIPLIGKLNVPNHLGKVPILSMHDRTDDCIRWQGGATEDGWIYEALETVQAAWARNHNCTSTRRLKGVNTPFDGGDRDLECMEYHGCHNGRVMQCMYDGHHGDWHEDSENLAWWFFSQYLPDAESTNDSQPQIDLQI